MHYIPFNYAVFCIFAFAFLISYATVEAQTGQCAAEANFQACKTIQGNQLKTCGPADYGCQCTAQKLIQQCYNLCPEYSTDATTQAGTVASICSAAPTTTVPPVPSGTWMPSSSASTATPSNRGDNVKSANAASSSTPLNFLAVVPVIGAILYSLH